MAAITHKPSIKIDEEILQSIQTEEQRTTVVHCRLFSPGPTLARIWNSTFLFEEDGKRVPLIKAFNIAVAPDWKWFISTEDFICFTLLFEGLSRQCSLFRLAEIIDEPGGFYSGNISRNKTDVYEVELCF